MATLKGIWVLNDNPSVPSAQLSQNVYFTTMGSITNANGVLFTSFHKFIVYTSGNITFYGTLEDGGSGSVIVRSNGSWKYSGVQTISFTTPQEVSEDFNTWFTATANPYSEEEETPTTPTKKFTRLYIGGAVASSGGKCFKRLTTVIPKLSAPTISISDGIISITNNNDISVGYDVYVDSELVVTITDTNSTVLDMSGLNLEAGTYSVYLTAVAEGYEESEPSNAVEYVVEEAIDLDSITDLTDTTWYFPKGWSLSAGTQRITNITGNIKYLSNKGGDFSAMYMGYSTATATLANAIYFSKVGTFKSDYVDFYVTFTGGTGVTNSVLLNWVKTWGELQ